MDYIGGPVFLTIVQIAAHVSALMARLLINKRHTILPICDSDRAEPVGSLIAGVLVSYGSQLSFATKLVKCRAQ